MVPAHNWLLAVAKGVDVAAKPVVRFRLYGLLPGFVRFCRVRFWVGVATRAT